jgi:hypothetical protein
MKIKSLFLTPLILLFFCSLLFSAYCLLPTAYSKDSSFLASRILSDSEDAMRYAPCTLGVSGPDQVALLATITPAYTVSSGGPIYLLQDAFDGAEGTNITAAGWTVVTGYGDPGDYMELDTEIKHSGIASCLQDHNGNATWYQVYRSFTQQSSGKFTIDFYYYPKSVTQDLWLSPITVHASNDDNNDNRVIMLEHNFNDLLYAYSGGDTSIAPNVFTSEVWTHIEIELNMDTNKFDIWVDGTEYNNSGSYWPFEQNVDPQYVYLVKAGFAALDTWIDDLNIYIGARVP